MTRSTLQRLRLMAVFVAVSAIAGACYGLAQESGGLALWPALAGAVIGAAIAAGILAVELLATRRWARLRRLPVVVAMLGRTAAYTTVIAVALLVFPWLFFDAPLSVAREGLVGDVASALWMIFVLGTAMTMVRLIGPGVLGKLLIGRYYRPREEQRVVMFLDLAGSTEIAERLGNIRFHALLADVFARLSAIVTDAGGEVHRYVGDGLIATWPVGRPVDNARAVACVLASADALTAAELTMQRRHGVSPRFRAGLHLGTLVVGEIGGFKREISYIGEAMNTAARVEQVCRDTGRMLVVSNAFLDGCELPPTARATSLGLRTLRGIAESAELFAIEPAHDAGIVKKLPQSGQRAREGKVAASTS